MLADFGRFVGLSALVIVTPGQDTTLVIRNALAGGRRGGVSTALGVVAGQATWTLAAGIGLTALLIASRPTFAALKLAGAAYLVWLGARSLHRAWSGAGVESEPAGARSKPTLAPRAAFAQGLLSALGKSGRPRFLPGVRRTLEAVLGATMVAIGLTIVTEHDR
jgi:threonine/homoserine/homoserine lactone efflux protein